MSRTVLHGTSRIAHELVTRCEDNYPETAVQPLLDWACVFECLRLSRRHLFRAGISQRASNSRRPGSVIRSERSLELRGRAPCRENRASICLCVGPRPLTGRQPRVPRCPQTAHTALRWIWDKRIPAASLTGQPNRDSSCTSQQARLQRRPPRPMRPLALGLLRHCAPGARGSAFYAAKAHCEGRSSPSFGARCR